MAGYAIVNLTAEWTLAPGWTLFARADNVFDRDYELAADFATGGAPVFAGVRWRLMSRSGAPRVVLPPPPRRGCARRPRARRAGGRAGDRRRVDDAATVPLAAPARGIVSLAPHAPSCYRRGRRGARRRRERHVRLAAGGARAAPVGNSRAIDLERIVALAPDLIVTWPYAAPEQVGGLARRDRPVFITTDRRPRGSPPTSSGWDAGGHRRDGARPPSERARRCTPRDTRRERGA